MKPLSPPPARSSRRIGLTLACLASGLGAVAGEFAEQVRPILKDSCLGCHSAQKKKGDLDLEGFVDEASVRRPMEAFLAIVDDEFGPFHIFRPYVDVRFSKNKAPYKTHIGAYGESQGGAGFYVQVSASGMLAASGYYAMASDQLERFRTAVDDSPGGSRRPRKHRASDGRARRSCPHSAQAARAVV